jgi:hypothetical protein
MSPPTRPGRGHLERLQRDKGRRPTSAAKPVGSKSKQTVTRRAKATAVLGSANAKPGYAEYLPEFFASGSGCTESSWTFQAEVISAIR